MNSYQFKPNNLEDNSCKNSTAFFWHFLKKSMPDYLKEHPFYKIC